MADLSSAHRLLQAKCQLVRIIYIKRIKVFLLGHIINILLTELSRSVWEKLDLGRVYRPHCVRSVLTTSVKILPYRPPARLIRGKAYTLLRLAGLVLRRFTPKTTIVRQYAERFGDARRRSSGKRTQNAAWQVTEVSTFILHLKLYLAFLSVFIVITYNNMTSFWL